MAEFNYTETKVQTRRISLLTLVMFAAGILLAWRLFSLQVVKHGFYTAQAAKSHSRKFDVPARRGEIMAHDGDQTVPLALNQNLYLLYADPSLIQNKDRADTAKSLAHVTGDSPQGYLDKLNRGGQYVVLKSRVESALASKIGSLKLLGIGLTENQYRTYPEGDLASQLLGFVNGDGAGQYGVEGYFNKDLAGQNGLLKAITDTQGNPIPTAKNLIKPPVDGSDLVLTIDRNIQAQAEKYLAAGVKAVRAKSGSVVVVDPQTGKVWAMANYPTYDPANYGAVTDYNVFDNRVVSNLFEPGSGFKIITMAAGLDTGKVKPTTKYKDTGSFKSDGYTVHNAENRIWGKQDMTHVITFSLNTGVIFILKQLGGDPDKITAVGKQTLFDYITKHFGFGSKTGVEQPAEAAGFVPVPGSRNINYANMSFGQGLSVTVMQMVMAATAIANGGRLYQPQLIDQIISPKGEVKKTSPRLVNGHIISERAASDLRKMMITVVEHGNGYLTQIKGYTVAGKTGTAQIPDPNAPGYLTNKTIGSFVGFLPANHPRFVMMVRIDQPQIGTFAETTTVPVFANIAKYLIRYLGIAPA